jgi:hypothetical protein
MYRNKYGAKKTVVDGITFDSKKESERYKVLRAKADKEEITHLELQPKYRCEIGGKLICTYKADFRYFQQTESGMQLMVEDVKGFKTPIYRLKKKLVEALYPGVVIMET